MRHLFQKLGVVLFLVYGANEAVAYEITGTILLDEGWERTIYLSAIGSFDDINTASEEFVVASAPIDSTGSFVLRGAQLPGRYALYRLHVVKRGDPVGTLFISGQEENHHHFVMNNRSILKFMTTGPLFAGARFENSPVNHGFNALKAQIDLFQKAPEIPSKANWDYREKQLQDYLLQYADSSDSEVSALYAVYHLNIRQEYHELHEFLEPFLNKWRQRESSSPYFVQLEEEVDFLRYRQSGRKFPYWIVPLFLALGLVAFSLWKKKRKALPADPFLAKQKQLTIQEHKIFKLLAAGKANKEISNELNIEVSTVKSHLNNIYSKLGVKSRKEIYNLENR